jgi:hypothetical protein
LCLNLGRAISGFHTNYPKLKLSVQAATAFRPDVLAKATQANVFGCSPAFRPALGGGTEVVTPHVSPRETLFRSIGYHVHLGGPRKSPWGDATIDEAREMLHEPEFQVRLAQMCDLVVGIPAMLLDHDIPNNRVRREIIGYGRAGEFRAQKHGFEYRALPAWPLHHPAWAWWAQAATRDALILLFSGNEFVSEFDMSEVSDVMNSYDLVEATKIWKRVRKFLLKFDGQIARGRTAVLNRDNIITLEFYATREGYKVLGKRGMRVSWRNPLRWNSFYRGFPTAASRTESKSATYIDFRRKWQINRNLLAPFMRRKQERYA